MPVITVEVVHGGNEPPPANVAQALADALGRALGSGPGETWVRLCTLASDVGVRTSHAEPSC
jgi:phenylpyruvate tautomerase PptA (4-oxalocrotonate tautomerase family)